MDYSYHVPVMRDVVIECLRVRGGGLYVDGTLGGGGHTEAILEAGKTCRVIGIDKDGEATEYAAEKLKRFSDKLTVVRDDFKNVKAVLRAAGVTDGIDGAVLDLGVSGRQIDRAERGFSYMSDAPLDMRMDARQTLTAGNIVNEYTEEELARIIRTYGEEDSARRIARAITRERGRGAIISTGKLADIIKGATPAARRGGHPAKKTFQALRIEVNGELDGLETALRDFIDILKPGAVLCVISFHSLEDRAVKRVFREAAAGCICDKSLPICVCGHKPSVDIIAGPVEADKDELYVNPRAASAKLRVIEKRKV